VSRRIASSKSLDTDGLSISFSMISKRISSMATDWERYCRRTDLEAEEDGIRLTLPRGSVHRLSVVDEPDAYRLAAIVVRPSVDSHRAQSAPKFYSI
jgi:hypothetical protein